MSKPIKILIFNVSLAIVTILAFSERGLGLAFDPSIGEFKFALSVALAFFEVVLLSIVNYKILTKKDDVHIKANSLSTIDGCIKELNKCKKTDPSFKKEISKAIEQLETLQRKEDSLNKLLELNDVSEAFVYLNDTSDLAHYYILSNVKSIISRLIAFDNDEYNENSSYDISPHKKHIEKILSESQSVLDEYSKILETISQIGDSQINLDSIKNMSQALKNVIRGKDFDDVDSDF